MILYFIFIIDSNYEGVSLIGTIGDKIIISLLDIFIKH